MATAPTPEPREFRKDRFDAYMRCAEASWKDMDARRVYEWKVSFGLWTALAVFAGFVLKGDVHLSPRLTTLISCFLVFLGYVYINFWTTGLRDRQLRSHQTAHFFWDLAEDELGVASVRKKAQIPPVSLLRNWAHGSEIIITCVLIAVALLSMWVRTKP